MDAKLIALDLDGTINENWTLDQNLYFALSALQLKHITVAITSGRDVFGCMYYAKKTGFPFDFICGGGGGILKYGKKKYIYELFDGLAERTILDCTLSKTNRILYLCEVLGIPPSSCLYIDDGPTPGDQREALVTNLKLGAVKGDKTWRDSVKCMNGYVSDFPLGRGVLDILQQAGLVS